VKKVLALAQKEAKQLNHNYVGTEHILLGLLREGEGAAARILKSLDGRYRAVPQRDSQGTRSQLHPERRWR